MEAIIIIIISSIIGYFLKNKDEKASKTPPPINRQPQRVGPKKLEQTMRKMEEYTKTVFQDIEKKIPESDELKKKATQLAKLEQPVEQEMVERIERKPSKRNSIPQTSAKITVSQKGNTDSAGFHFPKNPEELAQAFVMAEILGPPKSKR
ncbi:hypothetical protein [Rummeliibacillus pycnus]|uniref:hypothetical protein n=1 Tax=Rummeliibacillus pycnus TaxID=101070 RepID=UPI003D2C50EE